MNRKSHQSLSRHLAVRLLGALLIGAAAGPLSAQLAESEDSPSTSRPDLSLPPSSELATGPEPPTRPQVPFANNIDEVVVYGRRDPLGLPDSIRTDIWRSQRREMEAMMLERERMSSSIAMEGYDALLGDKLKVLPSYDPTQERQINYGVNDSTPVGVINIFGGSFGKKKNSTARQRDY